MKPRLSAIDLSTEPVKAMHALGKYLAASSIEMSLQELVKIRASQLNGCAYCLDMHTKDARAAGETEQRIYALSAWRETPFFNERERAALAWTEAVTLVPGGVSDELYEEARAQFSEQELIDLTWAIGVINVWNRLAVSFRSVPGTYQPPRRSASQPRPAAAAAAAAAGN